MNVGDKGIELIRSYEKLRLKAYLPTPNDKWTCGWGSTKGVTKDTVWTEEEAEQHFREDIADVERCLNRAIQGIVITQNAYDAIASLCFNIGCPQFRTSTVLRCLLDGDDECAARAFALWNKQTNKKTGGLEVVDGLTKRRAEEEALFRS